MNFCRVVMLVTHSSYRVAPGTGVHVNVGVESVVSVGPVTTTRLVSVNVNVYPRLQLPGTLPFHARTQTVWLPSASEEDGVYEVLLMSES
jgi:hypothetical protein